MKHFSQRPPIPSVAEQVEFNAHFSLRETALHEEAV